MASEAACCTRERERRGYVAGWPGHERATVGGSAGSRSPPASACLAPGEERVFGVPLFGLIDRPRHPNGARWGGVTRSPGVRRGRKWSRNFGPAPLRVRAPPGLPRRRRSAAVRPPCCHIASGFGRANIVARRSTRSDL